MDTADPDTLDRADMARLVSGHDPALSRLMDRHAATVFQFLYRLLGNVDDANDLAQQTFVRVFQHRARFRPEARFTTWLYTIAANLARNHHRWRSRHPHVSFDAASEPAEAGWGEVLPAGDPSPSEALAKEERLRAVRAAVHALPRDLREAVILCEWQDLPVADAAVALGTTPKAVESRLYRARQRLRGQLSPWL